MKRGVAVAILGWAALWPLAQRVLVATHDVNPWKLGGFAMYTSATPPIQVVVLEASQAGLVPIDEATLPARVRAALRRFRIERHALGALRSPEPLGRAILGARPDLDFVLVAIQRMRLDPATARITSSGWQHWIPRDGPTDSPRARTP